jgi:hypothetical protein
MGGKLRAAIAALFLCVGYDYPTCIIVTDGSDAIIRHEIAHCNGWKHKPFDPILTPPPEYDHPYAGPVDVTVSIPQISFFTYMTKANNPAYHYDNRFVWQICQELWSERGITPGTEAQMSRLAGCQVWGQF